MALVNAGRPPSVGSFSRSAMTTRLCGEVESALRQSHCTVQLSGTMICSSPFRCPLIKALPSAPRVIWSARVTAFADSSTTSQPGAASAGTRASAAGVCAAARPTEGPIAHREAAAATPKSLLGRTIGRSGPLFRSSVP